MAEITSLTEAMEALLAYSPRDMKGKYTLERMRKLLEHLGNPQESYRSIHIAGTSGKTSTAYFVRGALERAGQKTGLTVSPHIVAINERVQVGGVPLEEPRFLAYLNEFLEIVADTDLQPTYFELLVALAYWVFAKEHVDYAVVETGLGGLLDGTNAISRQDKVCVISNIGFDHTEILGDTLPLIAEQKAGIIQPGNHVIVRQQADEIMAVFERVAHDKHAELQLVDDTDAPSELPEFQHQNWALAMQVYECLRQRDGLRLLTQEDIEWLIHQTPPGRGEFYEYAGKTIILDGAHNPQKIDALLHSLEQKGIAHAAVLANFVESPDVKLQQSVARMRTFARHWIVTEFSAGQDLKSRHSFAADRVVELAGDDMCEKIVDPHTALAALLERPESVLLVTGSLYLVSLLRPEILKLQRK